MTVGPALLERVRGRLALEGGLPTPGRVAAALREEGGRSFGDVEVLSVLRALQSEIVGVGPLEVLLADREVTDVLVNGPVEVWVDRARGLERVAVRVVDEAAVRRLAVRMVAPTGRRLDHAQPWVDARLSDGVRLHAVLPPVAAGGTCVSRRRPFALAELVSSGTVPLDGVALLGWLVAARVAFLVSGGTGTGKTTLLSALLSLVDAGDRTLLVEDAGELARDHRHVVRLEACPANIEGAGEVSLRDLVRQALRMRPDRLVVGEVRGAEVVDLLAALNTGHDWGCGTLHANGAADVPARLEALAPSPVSVGRRCTARWRPGCGLWSTSFVPPEAASVGWGRSASSSGTPTGCSALRTPGPGTAWLTQGSRVWAQSCWRPFWVRNRARGGVPGHARPRAGTDDGPTAGTACCGRGRGAGGRPGTAQAHAGSPTSGCASRRPCGTGPHSWDRARDERRPGGGRSRCARGVRGGPIGTSVGRARPVVGRRPGGSDMTALARTRFAPARTAPARFALAATARTRFGPARLAAAVQSRTADADRGDAGMTTAEYSAGTAPPCG